MVDVNVDSHTVGEVSFQASGEHLRIVDTADDHDSFYVWIGNHGPYCACQGQPGDDFVDINLNLTDGDKYPFEITDDSAGDDVIGFSAAGTDYDTLPYIHP